LALEACKKERDTRDKEREAQDKEQDTHLTRTLTDLKNQIVLAREENKKLKKIICTVREAVAPEQE
jgi:hypothetical protein